MLALGFLYALCTSRIGRTLVAIKQNEPLVRAQGISPMPYKLAAFAIAAAITGVAGGIYTFHLKIIDPLFLDFYYMQTSESWSSSAARAASGAWSSPAS